MQFYKKISALTTQNTQPVLKKVFLSYINARSSRFPPGTQRLEDVPLWRYFSRDVPDHNSRK